MPTSMCTPPIASAVVHPTTLDLLNFIQRSPSPYHCVATVLQRLQHAGFILLDERDVWSLQPGQGYVVPRDGAVVALRVGQQPAHEAGFRLISAHTDSPNLRIKPAADVSKEGYRQFGVEVYGGALLHTWFDRDLGLAGRVVVRKKGTGVISELHTHLVHVDQPLLRIPSLAIHLQRESYKEGLKINPQNHLQPVCGVFDVDEKNTIGDNAQVLRRLLAERLQVQPEHILSWDLSLVDVVPPTVGGMDNAFIFAPRLDNQAMCHAGLSALLRAGTSHATQVLCLYDHEEVGSTSFSGAAGSFGEDVLSRIAEMEGPGAARGAWRCAAPRSWQLSADMAHAVHPNYVDKHEPMHMPRMNGGPVIKINAEQHYATTADGAALFAALCQDAGWTAQTFVARTDIRCGSTIGPMASARLGIRTIDVGNPMLSMHSIREQAGAHDPERMVEVMTRFLMV